MNVPVNALHTPIVGDYVKYNEGNYRGEVVNAKLWDEWFYDFNW
jgi:hypothetical protein